TDSTDSAAAGPAATAPVQVTPASADASQTTIRQATLSKTPAADQPKSAASPAPKDEATATLNEIQKLRISPVPNDIEQAKTARRERNERIVDMATRVIRLTMTDDAKKPQFQAAVSQLLEARFQNALAGDEADIDIFCSDVQALSERDPKSAAAAEGVYYMARFAHTRAGLVGASQPVWLE
ncbi:MAG: hypothetical protein ACKPHU_10320, partial [Planctomycetaceae bacterium]